MTEYGKFGVRASRALLIVVLASWLSACALVPDYQRPDLVLPQSPGDETALAQAQRRAMADWWQRFDDPVLNALIDNALDENLSIALQAAKVRQARARLGLAQAQFYPTLGGQLEATQSKASLSANPQLAATPAERHADSYLVAASLGYELNLFSALAGHEAAQAQLLASAFSHDALRLTVISDIVANYMSLRAVQRKIQIGRAHV